LRRVAADGSNVMEATIALARAGGTTGEWANTLRQVFGEYRGPTGVSGLIRQQDGGELAETRAKVASLTAARGAPPRILVAKPGLDGHSNGAEQIAVAARDAGFEVVYQGIRSSPAEIAAAARDEDVDLIGLSILSGSHLSLVPEVMKELAAAGVSAPVVVGGIIPRADAEELRRAGISAVYTPKDYRVTQIMAELIDLLQQEQATFPPS